MQLVTEKATLIFCVGEDIGGKYFSLTTKGHKVNNKVTQRGK
jgi:hypothetical protein